MKKIFLSIILSLLSFQFISAQDLTHFKQNKTSFTGNISSSGTYYNAVGLTPRRVPFAGVVSGSFNLNLKGLILPFSFTYSDQNKSFRQPFNQFGLSPKYKWAKLHLGYRNINYGKYILGGHTVFGVGMELNPKKLRLGFIYGKLQQKTNQAINVNNPINDTLSNYSRKMMSFKIGYGDPNSYFDFIVLRAADDSLSLGQIAYQKGNFPAANVVAGIHSKIALTPEVLFEVESAYSIYTENQNSAVQFDVPQNIKKIIPLNASTKGSLAVNSKIEYKNKKGLKLGLAYRRIDPNYQSMGSYFLNNDLENITGQLGFKAAKQKLRFSGSIGLERNNLKVARNATTHKTIGSAMISYDPSNKFGVNINYSNYSINQSPGRIQIADSVKLYQTNGTFMVMPHVLMMSKNKKISHFISVVYTKMDLTDKNTESRFNNSFTTDNSVLSYSVSLSSYALSLTTSAAYNKVEMQLGNSTNLSYSFGANKSIMKNKMSLGLSATYTQSENISSKYNVLSPSLNIRTKVGKHHQIRLKVNMIISDNPSDHSSNTEQFGNLSYVYNF